MPGFDEKLTRELRRAARPAAPDAVRLFDEVARRRARRDLNRRIQAGVVAVAVLVAAVGSFLVLQERSRTGTTPVGPPEPTPGVTNLGLEFPVCHPLSIPGDFGPGLSELWVVQEEREPGAGCAGQGPVRIGVGDADRIAVLSAQPLEPIDGVVPWPYATPDIDGDGIDEIAIGTGGSKGDGYARIVLFRLGPPIAGAERGEIESVSFDCGPGCDPTPWIGLGRFVESLDGAYCETSSVIGAQGLIRWSAGYGRVEGAAWYLVGDTLTLGEQTFSRPDDGTYPPDDGTTELCGSPVTWPEDLLASPAVAEGPVSLPGVPFPVCRPMTISGDFGDAGNELVIFEEELVPGAGCEGSEGFQHIGVAEGGTVRYLSEQIRDIGQNENALWPYATPDIDLDGVDEIAVAIEGSLDEGYARIVLFQVQTEDTGGRVAPITLDCGPACGGDLAPWISLGTFVEGLEGAYCGDFSEGPDGEGLMRWSAQANVQGELWVLDGDVLRLDPSIGIGPGWDLSTDPLPDGTEELCGSPTHWPEDFPNYPPA